MGTFLRRARYFVHRLQPLPSVYGREFQQIYSFLGTTRDWTRDDLAAYKLKEIRSLIAYAHRHVPYYRDLFDRLGLQVEDITSLAHFAQLPILEPETLIDEGDRLTSDEFSLLIPIPTHTSGTTGRQKSLYRSSYQEAFRLAMLWRLYDRFGYRFRDRRVSFEAPHVAHRDDPLFDHDRVENNLVFNSHHLLAGQFESIIGTIREFQPRLVWGLTNLLVMLADHIVRSDQAPIEVPLVITSGEKVFPHTLALLRKAFTGRFVDYYGNRENTIGAWGEGDGRFTEYSEYCHLEPAKLGQPGDLVTTCLHNYAMPLIRYRVGDIVADYGFDSPAAARPSFTLVGGRGKDLLLSRDGLVAPYILTPLEEAGFNKFAAVQLEQLDRDNLIVRVVPRDNYSRVEDEAVAQAIIEEGLGYRFTLSFEYCEQIPLTAAGKFRPVISDLAVSFIQDQAGDSTMRTGGE